MPQNVPGFQFSDDAKKVRQFIYEHWCREGRGPNLREAHEATGLARERLVEVYRELDLGLIVTIQQDTQNVAILKCQPFSSYPSQVAVRMTAASTAGRAARWNRWRCRGCRHSRARRCGSNPTAPAASRR